MLKSPRYHFFSRCDSGYTYSVVLENNSALFPSRSVDYDIRLINRSVVTEEDSASAATANFPVLKNGEDLSKKAANSDTEEERAAKIEDLLHFVSEISNLDSSNKEAQAAASKRERRKSLANKAKKAAAVATSVSSSVTKTTAADSAPSSLEMK